MSIILFFPDTFNFVCFITDSNKSKTAAIKNKKSGKSRQKSTQNTASKQKNKTDEDKNASTLKSVSYPSEEEAMKKKLNVMISCFNSCRI